MYKDDSLSSVTDFPQFHFDYHYERLIDSTAFLWLQRQRAIQRLDYFLDDITSLNARINAGLFALQSQATQVWPMIVRQLDQADAGELFVALWLSIKSRQLPWLQTVSEHCRRLFDTEPQILKGAVSALGWLQAEAQPWLLTLLRSQHLSDKWLGVAGISVQRAMMKPPIDSLQALLQRPDCQGGLLQARILRLIGECKLHALTSWLTTPIDNVDVTFWAAWSQALLGRPAALQDSILQPGPYQKQAVELGIRAIAQTQTGTARQLINQLIRQQSLDMAMQACVALGDPASVDWLLEIMTTPALAANAGEAIAAITGLPLDQYQWSLTLNDRLSILNTAADAHDTADKTHAFQQALDAQQVIPDVIAIKRWWQQQHPRFSAQRYLGGQVTGELTPAVLPTLNCRLQRLASMELALKQADQPLRNTATVEYQR